MFPVSFNIDFFSKTVNCFEFSSAFGDDGGVISKFSIPETSREDMLLLDPTKAEGFLSLQSSFVRLFLQIVPVNETYDQLDCLILICFQTRKERKMHSKEKLKSQKLTIKR